VITLGLRPALVVALVPLALASGGSFFPVAASELHEKVRGVTAGGELTCAIDERGGVLCRGDGDHGQLGSGAPTRSVAPVEVVGL
jgi:hypothetical protein